ncbi:MAG: MBL fold metallo-hydrolase [Alphaproteobacteria bacterium]|nr:MBL fold metallo-hydrolase [Alphaproteobacteria bacterium]
MRRFLLYAAALVAVLVAAGYWALLQPAVEMWVFRHAAAHIVERPAPVLAQKDELSVLLCGTGSPLPDRQRAGPCALVAAGGRLFIVDAGIGSVRNLMQWHVPFENVAGVLITHFHSDHIPELGELRLQTWVAGRRTHLSVYGPPGIAQVVAGFEQAYALDTQYRTEHHGAAFLPPAAAPMDAHAVPIPAGATTAVVLDQNGLKITAIRVHHAPATPAYGYRFDYKGRSVVISGDTTPDEDLARAAKGADVLVHEGLQPQMVAALGAALKTAGKDRAAKIMHDIPGYHSSPVGAARIANEAGAKLLVFTHLLPPLPDWIARRLFLEGVAAVRPKGVEIGHDGLLIRLPAHSDAIEQTTLRG